MELISVKKDLEENKLLAERLLKCFIQEKILKEVRPIFILRRAKHIKKTINEYFNYLTDDY